MSVIFTSSACMPSLVMARRKSLSICMYPWVMARLCARDWVLVRSGSPSWAMDWLGHLSSAMDWLRSLSWAWMGEGLSLRAWTGSGSEKRTLKKILYSGKLPGLWLCTAQARTNTRKHTLKTFKTKPQRTGERSCQP